MEMDESKSLADLLGPWVDPNWDSGLVHRCREAWTKPLAALSRAELATLLRQRFAVNHLLPFAKDRMQRADDGTELYDGELQEAIDYASNPI